MKKYEVTNQIMTIAPVIPVVIIRRLADAIPLARALVAGGLPAIEVTLRSECAVDAIKIINEEVDGAMVGAGTVLTSGDVDAVTKAGAKYMVSPGFAAGLLDAADNSPLPLLPGVSSASEAMQLGERGYQYLKFFPAGPAGGPSYLKGLGSPLPQFKFCPTGGINLGNATDYLSLSNVLCVGGSWVAPSTMIKNGEWDKITELARAAAGLNA